MTEPPRKGEADCETPSVLRQNVPVFILPIFALLWIANVGASWLIRWPSDAVGSSHPLTGEELGVAGSKATRNQLFKLRIFCWTQELPRAHLQLLVLSEKTSFIENRTHNKSEKTVRILHLLGSLHGYGLSGQHGVYRDGPGREVWGVSAGGSASRTRHQHSPPPPPRRTPRKGASEPRHRSVAACGGVRHGWAMVPGCPGGVGGLSRLGGAPGWVLGWCRGLGRGQQPWRRAALSCSTLHPPSAPLSHPAPHEPPPPCTPIPPPRPLPHSPAPRLRPGNPEVPALPGARTPRPLLTPARKRGGAEERRATPTSGKGAGLQARARPALAGLPGHARSGPRREAHADRRACTPTRDTRAHTHSPKQTYKHAHGRRAHTHRHTCKRAHVRTRVGQTRADTSTRRQTPGTTAAYSQAGTRVCKHTPSQAGAGDGQPAGSSAGVGALTRVWTRSRGPRHACARFRPLAGRSGLKNLQILMAISEALARR